MIHVTYSDPEGWLADALERIDDDNGDDGHDPSDGPFLAQEPEEPDGFCDCPDFDSEDFEQ